MILNAHCSEAVKLYSGKRRVMDSDEPTGKLSIGGTDISHARLVELARLADQAKPFYDWVEKTFQTQLQTMAGLSDILLAFDRKQIESGLRACYQPAAKENLPILFDGAGRSYPHSKACYYFFGWLVRDAPKQRLEPLLQRIVRASRRAKTDVEIEAIAALIVKYRSLLQTFSWEATREIFIDRLEGSRRSISGQERETVVRTALLTAIQSYFSAHNDYGLYATVEIPAGQIVIGRESYDVSATLKDQSDNIVRRVLVPVKTRETEGGGHSHLFTRDIISAINAARSESPNDFIVAVIVARNWSGREADNVRERVDYAALFDLSPNEFHIFDPGQQQSLNAFIASILTGQIKPRADHVQATVSDNR